MRNYAMCLDWGPGLPDDRAIVLRAIRLAVTERDDVRFERVLYPPTASSSERHPFEVPLASCQVC